MDVKEIRWEVVDWMHLAQDRNQWRALVNTVLETSWVCVSFSRSTLLHGVN